MSDLAKLGPLSTWLLDHLNEELSVEICPTEDCSRVTTWTSRLVEIRFSGDPSDSELTMEVIVTFANGSEVDVLGRRGLALVLEDRLEVLRGSMLVRLTNSGERGALSAPLPSERDGGV